MTDQGVGLAETATDRMQIRIQMQLHLTPILQILPILCQLLLSMLQPLLELPELPQFEDRRLVYPACLVVTDRSKDNPL